MGTKSGRASSGQNAPRLETVAEARARRERAMADLTEVELHLMRRRAATPPASTDTAAMAPIPTREPTEDERLQEIFTYHPATPADQLAYTVIRLHGQALAKAILQNTPRCADQTAAIRKVREAVHTANAARALNGLV